MKRIRRIALRVLATLTLLSTGSVAFAQSPDVIAKVNEDLNQGRQLIGQNRAKEAIKYFRSANELAPHEALILCNLGFALERDGQYDEALKDLTESIKINSNIPIAWVNLAGLYQSTGNLPKAIETYEEYLRKFPTDKNAADARGILDIIKQTNKQNAANNATPDSPDYFLSVRKYGPEKWRLDQFPLKVFVSHGDPTHGYQENFYAPMCSAFTEWQQKTNNAVSFVFVDSPAAADISVRWTNDLTQIATSGEAGDCRTKLLGPDIRHADITMLLISPSDSIPLGPALVHWVGLHEIGHALGIAGHSVNPHDIMYSTMSYDYDRHSLSSRDLATMHRVYER
ncbi:MAG TPA: tetratricopeptide repeat protein [Drouetiella sp.]